MHPTAATLMLRCSMLHCSMTRRGVLIIQPPHRGRHEGTDTMNSFDAMGQAQLLAAEGQRQIAAAIARGIGQALLRALDAIGRHLPQSKAAPW